MICGAAAQAKRQVVTLEEEEKLESKDQCMGLLLDKLGAAIHGRHINVMPNKVRKRAGLTMCCNHIHVHS